MTLARHANYISGVCFFQLGQLRIVRRFLTADAAHALVRALKHTRIDYCNGLLVSCPRYLTDRGGQGRGGQAGAAATLGFKILLFIFRPRQLPYRSSVSEVMHRQLHWLDVEDPVNYKFGHLVYIMSPWSSYLADQFIPASTFAGCANTRSFSRLDRQLYVPRAKTKTLSPRRFY